MKKVYIFICILFFACTAKEPQEHAVRKTSSIVLENNLDPICQMDVQINRTDTMLYHGKIYGFCSPVCKETFIKRMNKENKIK